MATTIDWSAEKILYETLRLGLEDGSMTRDAYRAIFEEAKKHSGGDDHILVPFKQLVVQYHPEWLENLLIPLNTTDVKPVLELHLLGQNRVLLNGMDLRLGTRAKEILTVLALNPEGLRLKQLAHAIYGNLVDVNSTKVHLSGLRKQVPILKEPYRIDATIVADFFQVLDDLAKGELLRAVALYSGELLLISESPAIVEHREYLAKVIRAKVIESENLEAILYLTDLYPGDIELWELARRLTKMSDSRSSMVVEHYELLMQTYDGTSGTRSSN